MLPGQSKFPHSLSVQDARQAPQTGRRSRWAGMFSTSEQHRRGGSTCAVNPQARQLPHVFLTVSNEHSDMFHLLNTHTHINIHTYTHTHTWCMHATWEHFLAITAHPVFVSVCAGKHEAEKGHIILQVTSRECFLNKVQAPSKPFCMQVPGKEEVGVPIRLISIASPLEASVPTQSWRLSNPGASHAATPSPHKFSLSFWYVTYTLLSMEKRDRKS